ncbi:MAG: hypothetical protein HC857_17910, partial [Synechococcales cyanobacterium RU_4_20]|nr:hypothetical protein [Synechococcales cyanobacterium RU_4_20]
EYADVLGIPFDFTARPVVAPPQRPRQTIQVKAVRPDRDALEIRFPRVKGYRVELPEERLEQLRRLRIRAVSEEAPKTSSLKANARPAYATAR